MLNLRNLDQLLKENLKDKIIFIRVDLNVPIKDEIVLDETRIERIIPTINALLEKESKKLHKLRLRFDEMFTNGGEQSFFKEQDQWITPNSVRVIWR